jgi:hypothetical protein
MAFGYFLYWRCGMALIKCPECGREVSEAAVACPGCGYPIAAGAVGSGEKTPEPSRPTKPTNMGAGGGDPAPDKSDLYKIDKSDLAKIHKRDTHGNLGQSIRATHPARADHWDDGGINGPVWPEDVVLSLDSGLVVGWKPPCGHQFPMPIKHWINEPVCPKCDKRFEDPKSTYPSKPASSTRPSKPAAVSQTARAAAVPQGVGHNKEVEKHNKRVEKYNQKVLRRKSGVLKLGCPGCGLMNAVDYDTVDAYLNPNSRKNRRTGLLTTFADINSPWAPKPTVVQAVVCAQCQYPLVHH